MKKNERRRVAIGISVTFIVLGVVLFFPPHLPNAQPMGQNVADLVLTTAAKTYTVPMVIAISNDNSTGGIYAGGVKTNTPVTVSITIAPLNSNNENVTKIVKPVGLSVAVNNSILASNSTPVNLQMSISQSNMSFNGSAEALVEYTRTGYWSGTFHFEGSISGTQVSANIPVTLTDLYIFPSSPPVLGGWGNVVAVMVVGALVGGLVYVLLPSGKPRRNG
jgi:hypothetical protein